MSPEGNPPEKKPEAPSAGVPEKPAEPAGPETKPITAPTPPAAKPGPSRSQPLPPKERARMEKRNLSPPSRRWPPSPPPLWSRETGGCGRAET